MDYPLPVAVVLHRGKDSGDALLELLARASALPVAEAHDKEPLLPGHVYPAPPDYHLLVEGNHLTLSVEPPVSSARPSVDVLFESPADAWGPGAIAVLLTGASTDGAQGVARVKQRGGVVLVQDPETAASPVLPKAALAAVPVDAVASPAELAPLLVRLCRPDGK